MLHDGPRMEHQRFYLPFMLGLAACGAPEQAAQTQTEDNLYGNVNFSGAACTSQLRSFNETIVKYGRIASATKAFEQCVTDRVNNGTYRQCSGDPGHGLAKAEQIKLVLAVARSTNDIQMKCSGGGGNASAGYQGYNHTQAEKFTWGGWLSSVHGQLGKPLCSTTSSADCRYAAHPWPYSQAAGIVWHEVMHSHDYTHGANGQAAAIVNCGYEGDATWHFQVNTMPYIVGQCITEVIDQSGAQCGNPDSCAGSNRLRMVDAYNGTSCSCKNDPRHEGLGTLGMNDGELTDEIMFAGGDWFYGGWHYGANNQIMATGDFDGDGDDDFIISSGWGLALVRRWGERFYATDVKRWGTWIGGWRLSSANTIEGTGNFDGTGGKDLIIRSGWGIGVLSVASGKLVLRDTIRFNTYAGNWWATAADTIEGVGDFDGDGRDEFILRRASFGFAFVDLDSWASGSSRGPTTYGYNLSAWSRYRAGTRYGEWDHRASDVIAGVGDFDGNGKDDLLIKSWWGFGILTKDAALTTLGLKPFSSYLGSWYLRSSDTYAAVADFDGDGRDELLIRGASGTGIIGASSTGWLFTQRRWPNNAWVGGWRLGALDTVGGTGDFNGDGKDDFVVRSGWGLGVIAPYATPKLLDGEANGTLFGAWLLDGSDQIAGVGDFDDDGKAELLLTTH